MDCGVGKPAGFGAISGEVAGDRGWWYISQLGCVARSGSGGVMGFVLVTLNRVFYALSTTKQQD